MVPHALLVKEFLTILFFLLVFCRLEGQEKGLIIKRKKDSSAVNFNERLALVMGNASYTDNPLKNPVHDALEVAAILKKYGFTVLLDTNSDRATMNRVINDFGDSLVKKNGVGLFYYSGHGIQYNARNFLLPVKSSIRREADIEDEAIAVSKIFEKCNISKNGLSLIVLDACRNNPYSEKFPGMLQGLNDLEKAPGNTLVFYATRPNETAADGTGENSPFTESFIRVVSRNDSIELFQLIKQVTREVKEKTRDVQYPWIAGTLDKDFYFKEKKIYRKPQLFILSFGISAYKNSAPLKYGTKGAFDFAFEFRRTQGDLYDSVFAYILINNVASREKIYSSINEIKQKAREGDIIYIYYNGHMIQSAVNQQYYWMPAGADFNDPIRTGVSTDDIIYLLARLPCKSLLFLDGPSVEGIGSGYKNPVSELTAPGNNVVVFAAAKKGEPVLESNQFEGSAFIHALINGLRDSVFQENKGFVDVKGLGDYIETAIPLVTNGQQHPLIIYPSGWKNFIVTSQLKPDSYTKPIRLPAPGKK